MSKASIYVIGENEDGAFIREYDDYSSVEKWLSEITTGTTDEIDLSVLNEIDESISFDCQMYSDDFSTFTIIEGETKDIEPEEVVTRVSFE